MTIQPIRGSRGDDNLSGTSGNDVFNLTLGGNDTVNAGDGNDVFWMGGTLTKDDRLDGGTGDDRVNLNGDYTGTHAVVFDDATMTNVEKLYLVGGHSYELTLADGNVAAGAKLGINASSLGAGDSLTFDGSAETDGAFNIAAGAGDDVLTGGANNDVFHMENGGSDTVHGGDGNDIVYMGSALGTFGAVDTIDGGAGFDTVVLNGMGDDAIIFGATTMTGVENLVLGAGHSYVLVTADETVAAGESLFVDGSALGASDTLNFDGSAESDGTLLIAGGAGNDILTGGDYFNEIDLSLGGNDTYTGGAGINEIYMGAALTAADKITGGSFAGGNIVILDGDYSGGVTFNATTMVGIDTLSLTRGHSYNLTSVDATVASGAIMTVDASFLSFHDSAAFDGSAETNGAFNFYDGAGNDTFKGGAGADLFSFEAGGSDTGQGGGGDDFFDACGRFSSGDQFDGGSGYDIIELTAADTYFARYTGGNALHLTAAMMANFEEMDLDGGGDYDITTVDGNVAAGVQFLVDATNLLFGDKLHFDGSAESDGSFDFSVDEATYSLVGGAGDDVFHVHGGFSNLDKIDGGGAATADGNAIEFDGDYALGFSATAFKNIQSLRFDGGHDYDLTLNDANVASGATLTVDGTALGASDQLTFDASNESDATINFYDGGGDDFLAGGKGTNYFNMTGGGTDTIQTAFSFTSQNFIYLFDNLTAADTIQGNIGYDEVRLEGDYTGANAVVFTATTMTGIDDLVLGGGYSYDLTTNDATVDSLTNPSMTVDSTALGASDTLAFNGSAELDSNFIFDAGQETDTLTGGAFGDTFNMGANLTAADAIDGGGGIDTANLDGDYTGANALVFGATTMVNVEDLVLAAGNGYDLTTNDATVASGETLTVDASALGAGDSLTFDGSAEIDGHFDITGGADDDVLTGGSKGDTLTGGGGADTFKYTAAAQSTSVNYDTITDFTAGTDKIDTTITISAVLATPVDHAVSAASFDTDLSNAGGPDVLFGKQAWIVHANGGDLIGHDFLVVDLNGNTQYNAGTDLVIDITGYSGTITVGDFI